MQLSGTLEVSGMGCAVKSASTVLKTIVCFTMMALPMRQALFVHLAYINSLKLAPTPALGITVIDRRFAHGQPEAQRGYNLSKVPPVQGPQV